MPDQPRTLRLRVAEVIAETPEACSIVFDDTPQLIYRPGQFLTFKLPGRDGGVAARCYSLAGSPHTGEPPKVTVKRVPGGHGSNWLCDHAAPGTELEVLPPAGTFTPRDPDADLLLLAGGSGITPVMSLLKSALAHGSGTVVLLYANRAESAVIFGTELRRLAEAHPGRLLVLHWLESLQGLPDEERLANALAPYASRDSFLCGPEPLMDAAEAALRGLGTPRERLHRERFFSLGAEAFDAPAIAGAPVPPEADPGGGALVRVELDGESSELEWPSGTRLLDALLAAGVDAPYSCREGACAACTCRVVTGEVTMARNEVLDETDLADGYILACQATPCSDRIEISYS